MDGPLSRFTSRDLFMERANENNEDGSDRRNVYTQCPLLFCSPRAEGTRAVVGRVEDKVARVRRVCFEFTATLFLSFLRFFIRASAARRHLLRANENRGTASVPPPVSPRVLRFSA